MTASHVAFARRLLLTSIGAVLLGPSLLSGAPRPAEPPKTSGKAAAVFVSAKGLTPTSPRQYSVCTSAGRPVKVCTVGRAEAVPPGRYQLRVGFPSAWVTREVELKAGDRYVVPTGLFTFRQVTPPDWPSTVPQQLYAGGDYLVSGYQGSTARLLPGKYTVLYQDPGEPRPSECFSTWHVAGPFRGRAGGKLFETRFAPEGQAEHDPSAAYTDGRAAVRWRKLDGAPGVDLNEAVTEYGVAYAFSAVEVASEKTAQLTFVSRGPTRLWLNGRPLYSDPRRPSWSQRRLTMTVAFRKGRNELLVKVLCGRSACPLIACVAYCKRYEVEVAADGDDGPSAAAGGLRLDQGAHGASGPADPTETPCMRGIIFCQIPDAPDGSCRLRPDLFFFVRQPDVARICSLIPAEPNGVLRNLTPEFSAAMHPTISCDATRILFAARENARDHFDIWEMDLDGSAKRRITRDMGDCLNPCYLPNGRIVFSCGKNDARDEYDKEVAKTLFVCDMPAGEAVADGEKATQITFNLSSEFHPTVLDDGRILFTSWQHQGNHMGEAGVFPLFTCNPDGTVTMPFYGNQPGEGGAVKGFPRQLADGRVVCVEVAGRNGYGTGALATLDPANPTRTFTPISGGRINYTSDYWGGRFTTPWPLADGRMLCGFTPGRVIELTKRHPAEGPHLGIYWFDFRTGGCGRLVFDDPHAQDFAPVAIMPRPAAPVIPSLVQPDRKTGTLLCVNPYLSDRKPSKSATIGQLPPARPGEIKAVRVVEGFGNIDRNRKRHAAFVTRMGMAGHGTSNTASSFEQKRIIGCAPVEADGSFHIEVPADTTMHLQLLDGNDMAIETQLTWVWVRPGEARFCVGCHESRETGLPNLDCLAMRRVRPHFVAPPPEQRRTVDFRRDIMPIIQGKCATPECHGGRPPTGGLDLGGGLELVLHREGRNHAYFNRAYESLLAHTGGHSLKGRIVEPGAARHSPLIWRLYDRQLGINDPRVDYRWPEKPKSHKSVLTNAERKLLVEWVDIVAQWDNIPGDDDLPGYDQDTSRRLARAAAELLSRPMGEPKPAFEARCLECHGLSNVEQASRAGRTAAQWAATVTRMAEKRPGWIHEGERALILEHIRRSYAAQADRGPSPGRRAAAP